MQLILLFCAQGGFGSPGKQAPFRVTPAPKAEVDEIDEHLQSLILGSESDSVAYIHLPKQLPLEEGAAEVLQWFSDTSQEQGAGDSPITDTGCAILIKLAAFEAGRTESAANEKYMQGEAGPSKLTFTRGEEALASDCTHSWPVFSKQWSQREPKAVGACQCCRKQRAVA